MSTRERQITETAIRLFHRHGYRKVTMMDIAAEAGMSRPSLYARFPNKEAIFAALLAESAERHEAEAAGRIGEMEGVREKLGCLFEIWILRPFASVAGSENGAELLANSGIYAPEAASALYARFEGQVLDVLRAEMAPGARMSAAELAHLLVMATRGLKATTSTPEELRRLTDGLITMAVAAAE